MIGEITVNVRVTVTKPISFEALIVTEREETAVVGVPEIIPVCYLRFPRDYTNKQKISIITK